MGVGVPRNRYVNPTAWARQRIHPCIIRFPYPVSRAIPAQMQTIREHTDDLTSTYPDESPALATVRDNAMRVWDELTHAATQRQAQLAQAHSLQKFLADSRDGMTWGVAMERSLRALEKPDSVFAADNCIDRLAAMRAEIVQPARVAAHQVTQHRYTNITVPDETCSTP